jgi:hypothetical protein
MEAKRCIEDDTIFTSEVRNMPYGAVVQKLDTVLVSGTVKIAVLPEVMKMLNLTPDQTVDDETGKKIVDENDRLTRTKN